MKIFYEKANKEILEECNQFIQYVRFCCFTLRADFRV